MAMVNYLNMYRNGDSDQMTPDPDRPDQVKNNAGGYVFKLDDWGVLDRFLILGSESNTYYCSAKELTIKNAQNILKLLDMDGKRVVDRVVEISQAGRAPKNDPAIFVLALAASHKDNSVRSYALKNVASVARTGTHLFQFINYCNKLRGWGRALRRTISEWYTEKDLRSLVYQVMKYKSRCGWTHRDVLRKAHPQPKNYAQNFIFKTIANGFAPDIDESNSILELINAEHEIKRYYIAMNLRKLFGNDVDKIAQAIVQYDLPREVIPTNLLNEPKIWEALLEVDMPYTAMLRNLGKMSSVGVFENASACARVVNKLTNKEAIKGSRIHPVNILIARLTYSSGQGYRGSNRWPVNERIENALEEAFYESFNYLEPSNKRHLVALDVSSSMLGSTVRGLDFVSAAVVSAAMAMTMLKKEKEEHIKIMAFSDHLIEAPINRNMSLQEVFNKIIHISFGATDCALPMIYATENKIPIDVFTIWTDNETWYGSIKPHKALQIYREKMGINAKLISCGITATDFTIADPMDPGMLDIVGFDSAVPQLIDEFSMRSI